MRIICIGALVLAVLAGGASGAMRTTAHSHRYQIAAILIRGIQGTPIAGQGWTLEDVAFHDHVNPFFIVGAAGTESSVWRAPCASNPKNGWGLSSCGSGWYVPFFRTWRQAFDFYARYIRRQWPDARTPYDLHDYSACDACWGPKTVAWIRQLFGNVSIGLAYP